MPSYIATFHTHLAAMRSLKNVKGHAASAVLSPVPGVSAPPAAPVCGMRRRTRSLSLWIRIWNP